MSRDSVAVIGAGRWGTTLAELAARTGHPVVLFTGDAALAERIQSERANRAHLPTLERLSDGVSATDDLHLVAARSNLVILAVSAARLRPVARALGEDIDGSHLLVHALRGFEAGSLASPSRVLREETCALKVGAFIGPALSEALLAGEPSAAVIASRFPEVVEAVQRVYGTDKFRVYASSDVSGVEAAGVVSGVLALAVGVCLELGLGPASLAVVLTRGMAELARLSVALGGEQRTAYGLAGLGDLLLHREAESLEVRAGRLLARGAPREVVEKELGAVEALEAAKTFVELARARGVAAPLTAAVHGIVTGRVTVREALEELMARGQYAE